MTNGSSQGLFIIVAVVIFQIFVAISYSIFRGTLQPALANIFKDSTFQAKLAFYENLTDSYGINIRGESESRQVTKTSNNHYILDNRKEKEMKDYYKLFGIHIGNSINYESFETYRFSFKAKLLEGELTSIGGHTSEGIDWISLKVNGEDYMAKEGFLNWRDSIDLNFEKNKVYSFELIYSLGDIYGDSSIHSGGYSWIQPNRKNILDPTHYEFYKLELRDISLQKIKNAN